MAKSLQLYCERHIDKTLASKNFSIIKWHVSSLKQLLASRIKGNGGAAGAAILAEMERLSASSGDDR
jgi:hypothetical protein